MKRAAADENRRNWTRVLVGAVLLLLSACRDPAKASGTALYVTADFDPSLLLTQVRVWCSVEGGQEVGPQVLPEQPQRLLNSGETLRVLLGDAANGVQAQVTMEGLSNNTVVARGVGSAQVRDGYEVEVSLHLDPVPADGADGGGDSFCMGCNGCCQQGHCTSSTFNTCGTGGVACVACDPTLAGGCDSRGVCVCGVNPACSPVTSDRCVLGVCRCGNGPACAAGQACVNGACVCNPSSCSSGCCSGNSCEPGTAKDKCGKGGAACVKCNKCNPDGTCG